MSVPRRTPRQLEKLAARFSRRYGVVAAWSDAQINQALADHGYPDLRSMPDRDTSTEARARAQNDAVWLLPLRGPYGSVDSAIERHRWRRVNAMHLLGHVICEHPDRCDACRDWFDGGTDGTTAE